ncbi:MAG: hypothetical protein AAF639_37610 [Chloroflexota bacterium]
MFTSNGASFEFSSMPNFSEQQSSIGWLAIGPGLILTAFAVSIIIWPQLLAYLVGSMFLLAGLSLTLWGMSVNRSIRRRGKTATYYEVS